MEECHGFDSGGPRQTSQFRAGRAVMVERSRGLLRGIGRLDRALCRHLAGVSEMVFHTLLPSIRPCRQPHAAQSERETGRGDHPPAPEQQGKRQHRKRQRFQQDAESEPQAGGLFFSALGQSQSEHAQIDRGGDDLVVLQGEEHGHGCRDGEPEQARGIITTPRFARINHPQHPGAAGRVQGGEKKVSHRLGAHENGEQGPASGEISEHRLLRTVRFLQRRGHVVGEVGPLRFVQHPLPHPAAESSQEGGGQ